MNDWCLGSGFPAVPFSPTLRTLLILERLNARLFFRTLIAIKIGKEIAMRFWARLNKKIEKHAGGDDLRFALLAGVLSADSDSLQFRRISSVSQAPIDPRQELYGGKTIIS